METNFANRSGWRISSELGIKGAGESGISAVVAAIANAVEDAIRMPVQSPSCQSRPSD
jgi:CO/xanthine dehydrogenase Mo-binding subunit